jgi:hypothetical protein
MLDMRAALCSLPHLTSRSIPEAQGARFLCFEIRLTPPAPPRPQAETLDRRPSSTLAPRSGREPVICLANHASVVHYPQSARAAQAIHRRELDRNNPAGNNETWNSRTVYIETRR